MVSLHDIPLPAAAQGHIRPVRPHRDLPEVADLIEMCFQDTLDLDGRSYLRQLRQAASGNQMLHWASSAVEMIHGLPVLGLVWEEAGRIVGNLSLIPLQHWRKRIYLIANVAVHPDHRGQGIGRALTTAALTYTSRRDLDAVWLQVRDDNPSAIHIYRSLGFEERLSRTSWICEQRPPVVSLPEGTSLGKRLPRHWVKQARWLRRLYPEELRWYVPLRWRLFQPGIWGGLARFFSLEYPTHWTILRSNRLLAVLTSLYEGGHSNTLWLSAPPMGEVDEPAVQGLLATAMRRNDFLRSFTLNLPAGYAEEAVRAAGFHPQQTLIWMQIQYRRD